MTLADSASQIHVEAQYDIGRLWSRIHSSSVCMHESPCMFKISTVSRETDKRRANLCTHLQWTWPLWVTVSTNISCVIFFRVVCPHTYATLCQRPTEKAFKKEEKLARRQKINRKKINVHKTVDFDKGRNTLLEACCTAAFNYTPLTYCR